MIRTIARSVFGRAARRGVGGGIAGAVLGTVAARVATRSVPGAILVGGGLLAKYLWDRRNEENASQDADPEDSGEPPANS